MNLNYDPIGEERLTFADDNVQSLIVPGQTAYATISAFGGMMLYTILAGVDPDAFFGRPIQNGEEQVMINPKWLRELRLRRASSATTYVYVTYYTYS